MERKWIINKWSDAFISQYNGVLVYKNTRDPSKL